MGAMKDELIRLAEERAERTGETFWQAQDALMGVPGELSEVGGSIAHTSIPARSPIAPRALPRVLCPAGVRPPVSSSAPGMAGSLGRTPR